MTPQAGCAVALAGVLGLAALAKLASPMRSAAALATFGLRPAGTRLAGLGVLVAIELGLAFAVARGSAAAAYAAAALMAGFAVALSLVLRRGGAGAPCACFGARASVSRAAVVRAVGLAGGYAALPSVPTARVSSVGWLAVGLAVALAGLLALGVAVVALAREIGVLRLRLGPQLALELTDEGPPLGRPVAVPERFAFAEAQLALAVFSSPGCPICVALEPAVAWLAGDPLVAALSFDEHADADVWRALAVPGSPYAVVLDRAGTVLAKGTFNTGGQLEGMLATAQRRAAPAHA